MALGAILVVLNVALALNNIWKEWQARRKRHAPHPLDAALRDIAAAIRTRPRAPEEGA